MRHLDADGCWETIAHGAQTTRRHPAVRIFEPQILRGPHLVLTHFGRNIAVHAFGQFLKTLQRVLRFDGGFRIGVGQTVDFFPIVDLFPPFFQTLFVGHAAARFPNFQQVFQYVANVADDRDINVDDFVDRRCVDVDMRFFRFWRKRIGAAGDTVVETCANADHQVTVVHGHVGFVQAVHAQHTQPAVTRCRVGAQTHQGRGDRETRCVNQFAQQLRCRWARVDHAAAGVEHRAFRFFHCGNQIGDAFDRSFDVRLVMRTDFVFVGIGVGCELNIFGDVDQHRARTARLCDVERFVDAARQFGGVFDQPVVFGARTGDANGVGLLERVRTNHKGRNLTREHNDRDRIHQRVGQTCHRVGRTRTRGYQRNANLAGGTGVTFGCVDRGLFVTNQNVFDRVLLENLIIDR